jgi:hypothetical protein
MAEFCRACGVEVQGEDVPSDLKGLITQAEWEKGLVAVVMCEGCGIIQVDPEGNCVSNNCLKAGQPGHGTVYNNGPEYEDGPWAEGWEDRNKGGDIE